VCLRRRIQGFTYDKRVIIPYIQEVRKFKKPPLTNETLTLDSVIYDEASGNLRHPTLPRDSTRLVGVSKSQCVSILTMRLLATQPAERDGIKRARARAGGDLHL